MSASIETAFDHALSHRATNHAEWDELPTDGSHAWFGAILMVGSAIITIRGLCWVAATVIRGLH
jgi:hypothetical protein